jgi:hypothetical protein
MMSYQPQNPNTIKPFFLDHNDPDSWMAFSLFSRIQRTIARAIFRTPALGVAEQQYELTKFQLI